MDDLPFYTEYLSVRSMKVYLDFLFYELFIVV